MADSTTVSPTTIANDLRSGAYTGAWTLDPTASTVTFKTKAMWGVVPVKGSFTTVSGTATVDDGGSVTGRLEIASDSVNTKMKPRDKHLRSEDFFHAEQYPHIVFDLDAVAPSDSGVTASGRLTVRDRTVPLSFPATVSAAGADVTLDAEVTVDRSEVGLGFKGKGATKMDNVLTIHATFRRA
jgi:polyisoprenoid-binding protein YceI